MCIFVNWKKYMFDCLMNDMNKKVYFLAAITASSDRKGSLVMGGYHSSPLIFVSNGYCRLLTTTTI